MPTATASKELVNTSAPKPRRRPILPIDLRKQRDVERIGQLQPWYFLPFHEPDVSPECRAYVLGEYKPDDEEEEKLLLAELVDAHTVPADANSAIQQAPGACSSERQFYQRMGFRLISPCRGESSGDNEQPFQMWAPQLEDGHLIGGELTDPYIGLTSVLAELERRRKWAIAQVRAKVEAATEMAREGDGTSRRYNRRVAAALKQRQRTLENGMPTVKELQLFFVSFERMRLLGQQDRKLKEERALQGRIDSLGEQQAGLLGDIETEGQWPPGGGDAA